MFLEFKKNLGFAWYFWRFRKLKIAYWSVLRGHFLLQWESQISIMVTCITHVWGKRRNFPSFDWEHSLPCDEPKLGGHLGFQIETVILYKYTRKSVMFWQVREHRDIIGLHKTCTVILCSSHGRECSRSKEGKLLLFPQTWAIQMTIIEICDSHWIQKWPRRMVIRVFSAVNLGVSVG